MVPGETAAGVRAFRVSVIEPLFPFSILRLPFVIAGTGDEGQWQTTNIKWNTEN
jgi:hypothetical protein